MIHKIGILLALAASLLSTISEQDLKQTKNHASDTHLIRTR